MVAANVRRRVLARKTLPPSRRASVSASLRRDRAEARGEGGKAPLRRDGGPPRYLHPPQFCYGGRVGGYGSWRRLLNSPCPETRYLMRTNSHTINSNTARRHALVSKRGLKTRG